MQFDKTMRCAIISDSSKHPRMALRVTRSSLALSPVLAGGCCRGLCSGWTLDARKEESNFRKRKELGPSWNGGLGGDVRLLKNYQGVSHNLAVN